MDPKCSRRESKMGCLAQILAKSIPCPLLHTFLDSGLLKFQLDLSWSPIQASHLFFQTSVPAVEQTPGRGVLKKRIRMCFCLRAYECHQNIVNTCVCVCVCDVRGCTVKNISLHETQRFLCVHQQKQFLTRDLWLTKAFAGPFTVEKETERTQNKSHEKKADSWSLRLNCTDSNRQQK